MKLKKTSRSMKLSRAVFVKTSLFLAGLVFTNQSLSQVLATIKDVVAHINNDVPNSKPLPRELENKAEALAELEALVDARVKREREEVEALVGARVKQEVEAFLKKEQQENKPRTANPPLGDDSDIVLWLTTCETRPEKIVWTESPSAKHFQEASMNAQNPIEVRLRNFCKGAPFDSLRMTKPTEMEKFLQNEVLINANDSKKHYVVFSDADVLLNARALPEASMVLEKFYRLLSPTQSVLIGAEPSCYMGHFCTKEDVDRFYPHVPDRTACPFFVNSGGFMGKAETLLAMMQAQLGHADANLDQAFTQDLQLMLKGDYDDQARMTVWYKHNKQVAALDSTGALFRNLVFGTVDASPQSEVQQQWYFQGRKVWTTCGRNGIKSCAVLPSNQWYSGHVNQTSGGFVMEPVPGCQTDPSPLFLHGNGWGKGIMKDLQQKLDKATVDVYKWG